MRVVLSNTANRDADRLPRYMAARIFTAVRRLGDDPRPPGCTLVRTRAPRSWRVRVGDWRVLYTVDDDAEMVTILRIVHRSTAYKLG